MNQHRELKRGTLEMVLLRILADGPTYGYQLVSQLAERSDGLFGLKEGTLYPVLYRLDDTGMIEPEWRNPERGVPRKYYRLTPAGRERLADLETRWRQFAGAVDSILTSGSEETS